MTLTIMGFEVEIKAKDTLLHHERFSKEDTMALLCELSMALYDASQYKMSQGYDAIARRYRNGDNDIYNALSDAGYFDDVDSVDDNIVLYGA